MKKFSKILAYILATSVCCLSLFSCHGKLETEASKEEIQTEETHKEAIDFDESKKYNLTFWAKNDTNITQKEIYEKAIEDFCALYPNISIKFKLYTDYSDIYNDVITNISTDTTPNICITYPDHIATYISGNETVARLNDLMHDENYGLGGKKLKFDSPKVSEIVPQFLGECAIGENYYALPFMRSSEACYVNKTMLENMGYTLPEKLTWDFIWEVSEAAMEKDENGNFKANGQKKLLPFIYKSTDNMMIQMLKQQNAPYSDSDGSIYIFNDVTSDVLKTVAEHAKTKAFTTFQRTSYPGNYMNVNQCIFAIDSTAGATWIGYDAPMSEVSRNGIPRFETEVMMIPQYDTENPKMISQGPSVCIFNKKDKGEVTASWLFMQYLLTNDIQIAYSQTEGYVPVTLKAQQSEDYQDYISRCGQDDQKYYDIKIKASKLVLDNPQNTFITPVFNGSASLRQASGEMIEDVTASVNRKKIVDDEYIQNLYKEMIARFNLKNISAPKQEVTQTTNIEVLIEQEKAAETASLSIEAMILVLSLATVWIILLIYSAVMIIKKQKRS